MTDLYWNPPKNAVRRLWFQSVDQARALFPSRERLHAVYLPGPGNHEGPEYDARGMTAHGVERRKAVHAQIRAREPVFLGRVYEYVQEHIQQRRPRLATAFLDFEGTLAQTDRDLLSVFNVFPAHPAGVLGVTVFACRDTEVLHEGRRRWPCLNAVLGGTITPLDYEHVVGRWKHTVATRTDSAAALNNTLREAALLWRLLLGMGFVSHPKEGPGKVDRLSYGRMAAASAQIDARCESEETDLVRTMACGSPELTALAENLPVRLWPASLRRIAYLSQSGCPMLTWFVSFARGDETVSWQEAGRALWELYSASPLVLVAPDGSLEPARANVESFGGMEDGYADNAEGSEASSAHRRDDRRGANRG